MQMKKSAINRTYQDNPEHDMNLCCKGSVPLDTTFKQHYDTVLSAKKKTIEKDSASWLEHAFANSVCLFDNVEKIALGWMS